VRWVSETVREEPLAKLQAADQAVRDQLEELADREEAAQLAAMLNGAPPVDPAVKTQQMLFEQVAANNRRLRQVLELDHRLSQRLYRKDSSGK
ncbi:MAG: hypothetical protein K2K53_06975, partial [Oscillospiraceae bacterium]|nr:hypothetical protein [Oscillospiraceae bacterium]